MRIYLLFANCFNILKEKSDFLFKINKIIFIKIQIFQIYQGLNKLIFCCTDEDNLLNS